MAHDRLWARIEGFQLTISWLSASSCLDARVVLVPLSWCIPHYPNISLQKASMVGKDVEAAQPGECTNGYIIASPEADDISVDPGAPNISVGYDDHSSSLCF